MIEIYRKSYSKQIEGPLEFKVLWELLRIFLGEVVE